MEDYRGVIIEESLKDKRVLTEVNVTKTRVSRVTDEHRTPWLTQWTLHTVKMPPAKAWPVARLLSRSLDDSHGGSWYADFRNDRFHFIVFRSKIFKVDTQKPEEYVEARKYGRGLGIPDYQLDFTPP